MKYKYSIRKIQRQKFLNNANKLQRKFWVVSCLLLVSWSLQSQDWDTVVCYNSAVTIKVPERLMSENNRFFWEIQNENTWQPFDGTWHTEDFLLLHNLTENVVVRCVVDTNYSGIDADTSDLFSIRVYSKFQTGTISGIDTICFGARPDAIQTITPCTGGDGIYAYQWEYSTNRTTWQTQTGATTPNFKPSNLQQTTFYRLRYTSGSGCGSEISNDIEIYVWKEMQRAAIHSAQTICWDSIPQLLTTTQLPSGADGAFTYQWQMLQNSTWTDISTETTNSYQAGPLRNTTSYRLKNTSVFGCGDVYSNVLEVTVYPKLQAGIIIGSQNVCYDSAPTMFSTNPFGGGNAYTYQWFVSDDSINFYPIHTATNSTYQSGQHISDKFYRAAVISTKGCATDTTNIIKVHAYAPFVAGTISGIDTICFDTRPDAIQTITPCTGGDGIYAYQWEYSTNRTTWQTQTGATTPNFKPSNLQQTTFYRLRYTSGSGCGSEVSNDIEIYVWKEMQRAAIHSAQTICWDSIPQLLTTTQLPSGADGAFTYQWQVLQNSTWTDISTETTNSYQAGPLRNTTSYRLKNTSVFGCGDVYSNVLEVTIYPKLQAGIIIGSQNVCYDSAPTMFSTNPFGGGNAYTYQWFVSDDSINFSPINTATNSTHQSGQHISDKFYKTIVTSTKGCATDTTNIIKVHAYAPFVAGAIDGFDTVCWNENPNEFTMISDAAGGSLKYSYQWQQSENTANWNNISNANNPNYQKQNLQNSTYYRLLFTSAENCGILPSNVIYVHVNPLPLEKNLIGETSVCANQYDLNYEIAWQDSILYRWTIQGGMIMNTSDTTHLLINWNNIEGIGTLELLQTNIYTGCKRTIIYDIQKNNFAPYKTNIIRKPGSNILICEDETAGLQYQWGFTSKISGQSEYIEESNLRYIQLPHTFDTTQYDYFVTTSLNYSEKTCSTQTYYLKDGIAASIADIAVSEIVLFPNPVDETLFIQFEHIGDKKATLEIYNLHGKIVFSKKYSIHTGARVAIPVHFTSGMYVLRIKTGDKILTHKIVVE